jgi:hypothetical protein
MADHIRKQIRDAGVTALSGLATTGSNVFSGRVSRLKESELPGLNIYLTGDDAIEDAYNGGATEMRSGMLRVEGVCSANDSTINTCDQMALEIEQAIFGVAGATLRALLMVPPGPPSAQVLLDEAAVGVELRLGTIVLSFPIQYRTRLGDPSTKV